MIEKIKICFAILFCKSFYVYIGHSDEKCSFGHKGLKVKDAYVIIDQAQTAIKEERAVYDAEQIINGL